MQTQNASQYQPEVCERIWLDDIAPITIKIFANFYNVALWDDNMRKYLESYNGSFENLPWNTIMTNADIKLWFPVEVFPEGPVGYDNKEALTKEWKSGYDLLFRQCFKNLRITIWKDKQSGLGVYVRSNGFPAIQDIVSSIIGKLL